MDIRIYQDNDRILVQLLGRVVLDECDRLKNAVIPRIVPGVAQANLDLSRVEFIDSAGLGVLVAMKVSANKSRSRLALISPSKSVSDILMVSKLDSIFDILTGREAQVVVESLAQDRFRADQAEAIPGAPTRPTQVFQAPPTLQPSGAGASRAQIAASGASSPTIAGLGGDTAREQIEQACRDAVEFMRQRDYASAAECYRRAISLDDTYLPAHNNLAIVYEKTKDQGNNRELAIKQWRRVLEISQSRGDQKHVERAEKHLQELS